jgi:hypothetical protein
MQKTMTTVLALLLLIGFTSCNNYGKKTSTGHVETYYQEGITEDQAKKVSSLIYNIDERAGNAKTEKSFQLCKKNDTVCFRMVVNKEKAMALGDFSFLAIANMVSDSVFNGAPVNMDLTNNKFESIKVISFKKLDVSSPEQ